MSKSKKASRKSSADKQAASRRTFYVFTGLTGALTLTGALLVAISPQPLRPDGSTAALAAAFDRPADLLAPVYSTPTPVAIGRWKYIYVHHSLTPAGSASSLAAHSPAGHLTDHFVIANGNGAPDGDLQITPLWSAQQPASSPTGTGSIDPACISICLVGDFDRSLPTPAQQHRLAQLIDSLQAQLRLPTHCVIMLDQPASPASVGHHFPTDDFRSQILR